MLTMTRPLTPSNIVLRFDMRSSPLCKDTSADRYRTALDMTSWADSQVINVVGLSEHHNASDGFLSAPLQLAGMMIARTKRVRVSVSALLVPLHNPLRLAEDISLIDQIAGGRFSVTCGLGYREIEYQCFDVEFSCMVYVGCSDRSIVGPIARLAACSCGAGAEYRDLSGKGVALACPQRPADSWHG